MSVKQYRVELTAAQRSELARVVRPVGLCRPGKRGLGARAWTPAQRTSRRLRRTSPSGAPPSSCSAQWSASRPAPGANGRSAMAR